MILSGQVLLSYFDMFEKESKLDFTSIFYVCIKRTGTQHSTYKVCKVNIDLTILNQFVLSGLEVWNKFLSFREARIIE